MPRVPRIQVEGASYLVHAQGSPSEPLFTHLSDYEAYLHVIAQYKQRYGFKLFAYCLMPQEVWLYLEPVPGTTVSAIMHDVTTGYTRYRNKRYGRAGHLFRDRFKAIVVETREALMAVVAYLHLLPVRKGLAPTVEAYPFSSDPLYRLGDTVPDLLQMRPDIHQVFQALPGEATVEAYTAALAQVTEERIQALEQQMKHGLIGSAAFIERAQHVAERAATPGTPVDAAEAARAPSTVPARPLMITYAGAVMAVVLCLMLSLSQRIDGLKQMFLSLAQESDALFRSRASVAMQHGTLTGLASLDGTVWDVRLAPLIGTAQASVEQDQLVFLNSRVSSNLFAAQGVVSAPYHLATMVDGSVGWESMQAGADGQLMSWQGQWHGTTMRGTITQQLPGEPARQFTFVGVAQDATEPRSEI